MQLPCFSFHCLQDDDNLLPGPAIPGFASHVRQVTLSAITVSQQQRRMPQQQQQKQQQQQQKQQQQQQKRQSAYWWQLGGFASHVQQFTLSAITVGNLDSRTAANYPLYCDECSVLLAE
jgi:hypothetical protein